MLFVSLRRPHLRWPALVALTLLVLACTSPSDTKEDDGGTTVQGLTGVVLDSVGGAPLAGASLTVTGSSGTLSATSGTDGSFAFASIPDGTYEVLVTQSGRASSRVQGVMVSGGTATTLDVVLPAYALSVDRTTPPSLAVTGIVAGSVLTAGADVLDLQFTATPGSSPVVSTEYHQSLALQLF